MPNTAKRTKKLLYILSPSYSGSTLLTFLLAEHPEIATVGELKASPKSVGDISTYRCSCGELLLECDFWRELEAQMKEKCPEFSLNNFGTHLTSGGSRLFRRLVRSSIFGQPYNLIGYMMLRLIPHYNKTFQKNLSTNKAFIEKVCEIQNKPIFLDGSKDPERLYHFKRELELELKVINLHRDGRGFVNSYKKHYNTTIENASKACDRINTECARVINMFDKDEILDLKYEDLCKDKGGTLKRIYEFIDITPSYLSSVGHANFHILGNDMRLSYKSGIKHDEKWKRELNSTELDTFYRIAGKWNVFWGYET